MTIEEIKLAVDSGKRVHWANAGYTVIKDKIGQYLITHFMGNCIGLTDINGKRLNGREEEFFTIGK